MRQFFWKCPGEPDRTGRLSPVRPERTRSFFGPVIPLGQVAYRRLLPAGEKVPAGRMRGDRRCTGTPSRHRHSART